MKLFGDFWALRSNEADQLLIVHGDTIYYIYSWETKTWRTNKDRFASASVSDHENASRYEVMNAMGGVFPKKQTDFARRCDPSDLGIGNMLDLLLEDYPRYMSDLAVRNVVGDFLRESDIPHKSYLRLKELLDAAISRVKKNMTVIEEVKELSFEINGRDIFKPEIEIIDGHDGGSNFWIMPVRIIDWTNTSDRDCVAEMRSNQISIDETYVDSYLTPFLYKYFDPDLKANQKRDEYIWTDKEGNTQVSRIDYFEWYLTYNFFTFDSIKKIINDINDTIDALSSGRSTEYTNKLREDKYIAEDELIIDFYRRFVYRIEYMLRVGEEKGYNLISFRGP